MSASSAARPDDNIESVNIIFVAGAHGLFPVFLFQRSALGTFHSPADLSDLPVDLLKRLKRAAIDTDMERVDAIVEEIREIKPGLASDLAALTVDFEYGKIVEIIEGKENV